MDVQLHRLLQLPLLFQLLVVCVHGAGIWGGHLLPGIHAAWWHGVSRASEGERRIHKAVEGHGRETSTVQSLCAYAKRTNTGGTGIHALRVSWFGGHVLGRVPLAPDIERADNYRISRQLVQEKEEGGMEESVLGR